MSLEKHPSERCSLVSPPGLQKRDGTGCYPDGFIPPTDNDGNSIFVGGPWVPPINPSPFPFVNPSIVEPFTRLHRLWLRDDFEVEIKLPADLTNAEMNRLMDFVGLLLTK